MIIAVKIAICAFVYTEILTDDKMILSFMRRLPYFFTCPYCIAGQMALWCWLFPYSWIDIFFYICLPIAIVHIFLIVNDRSQKNNGGGNGITEAEKVHGGSEIPIEPETTTN